MLEERALYLKYQIKVGEKEYFLPRRAQYKNNKARSHCHRVLFYTNKAYC